jgi:hypothetical protein
MNQLKTVFLFKISFASLRLCVFALILLSPIYAQSTDQNFPTSVTTNEINGKISARDIGDARLTTYYYVFNGNQGDVFINVVTKNLDGDIDVFTLNGLRPLTKVRVYSDNADSETGRIVYLRQPEKLILRIEGRTPNDDAATFRIKFAGSFEPLKAVAETEEQKIPEVKTENQSDIRVNSVGTIIEVRPKPTPQPIETEKSETVAEAKKAEEKKTEAKKEEIAEEKAKKKTDKKSVEKDTDEEKTAPVVVVTDKLPKTEETVKKEEKTDETKTDDKTTSKTTEKPKKNSTKTEKKVEPNPLENIKLVVLFRDGSKIEKPMSEIIRVNVDKGILTIIHRDGTIGKYSILDVVEMTIK